MLRTLRQPRYAALVVLMVLVAVICIGAGTWQIARFRQKVHDNNALRANARAPITSVDNVLGLVGPSTTASPAPDGVQFRRVTATGTYDVAAQSLVRGRSLGGQTGFFVLTPLHSNGGTLLVLRGFISQPASGAVPALPSAPSGGVTITARVEAPESRADAAQQLTGDQVESINPVDQAARLGGAVYNGYADLLAGQPGTGNLRAIPAPSLSNPAGGAVEPQHFAYIIQWYLFAALALAAPLAMARAETRQRCDAQIDGEISATPPAATVPQTTAERARATKLADRYGRAVR